MCTAPCGRPHEHTNHLCGRHYAAMKKRYRCAFCGAALSFAQVLSGHQTCSEACDKKWEASGHRRDEAQFQLFGQS